MKTYLGDGVYVDYDGFSLIITTNNGVVDTNEIYLEPEVVNKLVAFLELIKAV